MDIFGPGWVGHPERFFEAWRATVGPEDLVIVPGDISWALHFEEALPDLQDLGELPGIKVLLRGNHDYWWPAIGKLRRSLPPKMYALQNDALAIRGVAIAGTRGWITPIDRNFTSEDEKIYQRELERLRLSLAALRHLTYEHLIIAFHFPPLGPGGEPTGFTELISDLHPTAVVYGHLHGVEHAPKASWSKTPFHLVSADYLQFCPKLLLELPTQPQPLGMMDS